jgi:hypothetical protein
MIWDGAGRSVRHRNSGVTGARIDLLRNLFDRRVGARVLSSSSATVLHLVDGRMDGNSAYIDDGEVR